MSVFVHIVYIAVAFMLVLGILIQSGKGGGLGAGLGGAAAQNVFGGSGGADFMTRLTQAFAALFMVCAMYLAYEGTHTGSSFLKAESEKFAKPEEAIGEDGEIDWERIGPRPLVLQPALARAEVSPPPEPEPAPEPAPTTVTENTDADSPAAGVEAPSSSVSASTAVDGPENAGSEPGIEADGGPKAAIDPPEAAEDENTPKDDPAPTDAAEAKANAPGPKDAGKTATGPKAEDKN